MDDEVRYPATVEYYVRQVMSMPDADRMMFFRILGEALQRREAESRIARAIESRDFYELCQEYRHERLDAAKQFEAIKAYLLTGKLPWPSHEDNRMLRA